MSDFWQQTISSARDLRRELHQYPELGWEEVETAQRIRQGLTDLSIPWSPCADTGTVARLNPNGTGAKHIALRGDIDALPMTEQTGKAWTSRIPGRMHACGHDGHTATLMAAASWLKHHESQLPGPVTLLFQPAEEGGHGAQHMIAEGALAGVQEIYGWHNWPAIGFGKMMCPDGLVMCGNGTFKITVNGRGGHASQPELCRDPVVAASAITLALQQIISRRLPPQETVVVSVTSIEAPSGETIIPEQAVLSGSIRISSEQVRDQVNQMITEISQSTAQAYGVACEVEIARRYYATQNHAQQASRMRQTWQQEWGEGSLEEALLMPVMASEDFSYYLQEVPGAFALIGADDGPEHQASCHSVYYDFNDRLIELVTRLFSRLAGAPLPPSA